MNVNKIGSLFSGVGGLELGLERAGLGRTVWQCECEAYPRRVLAKHWPDAHRFRDVTMLPAIIREGRQRGRGPWRDEFDADIICGGFPCQDLSVAGKGSGLDGARSGLFWCLMRVVRLVRPRIIVLENVPALIPRGLDRVLGALVEAGYDSEWAVVSAGSVGAPHRRERVFVVACLADADGLRESQPKGSELNIGRRTLHGCGTSRGQCVADAEVKRRNEGVMPVGDETQEPDAGGGGQARGMGYTNRPRLGIGEVFGGDASSQLAAAFRAGRGRGGVWSAQPGVGRSTDGLPFGLDRPGWERGIPRVKEGVPHRTARLKALGNAVVPQVAEYVGRREAIK